ncbi:unnamed protein product [Didymodactylos carnosus]|uniref:Uncharacterized protein n=1 Tax=Didymodactylos carnosus TaxID=1234261 RepID=A0A815X156_9BILA|nr:unnamed protein product [Didymodactylos carnosus]CAF1551667.1 unnamed protein product [Didymodactylos carnosus]CAF4257461.1 unnamed protein product [Didymodactylos carnosus]CAF4412718.1 unnamed protein product [Didymodactylos carnosus]
MSKKASDIQHPIGYADGQIHLGKDHVKEADASNGSKVDHGGSKIPGQGGPEILGGSSSQRITGQSIEQQLKE